MSAHAPMGESTSAAARPPQKWKQIAVAFVVVYPLVTLLDSVMAHQISFIPQPLRGILIVLCMATVLTYVLPWASNRASGWLAK